MPRRKNSAEMLDVLRRLFQDEKARRVRQLAKSAPEPPPAPPRGTGWSWKGEGAVAPPSRISGIAGPDPEEREARGGVESMEGFLSVIPGGRVAQPRELPPELLAIAAPVFSPLGPPAEKSTPSPSPSLPPPGAPAPGTSDLVPPRANGGGRKKKGRRAASRVTEGKAPAPLPAGADETASLRPPEEAVPAPPPSLPAIAAAPELSVVSAAGVDVPADVPADVSAEARSEIPAEIPAGDSTEAVRAVPGRSLFARPADERGLRLLLERLVRTLRSDGISGGLKKRVEVRLATIGFYAVVALGAMLAVALLMNWGGGDPGAAAGRQKLLREQEEAGGPQETTQSAILPAIEIVPPGAGIPPEVRHVSGTSQPRGQGTPGSPAPLLKGEGRDAAGTDKVWKGPEAPPGFYVQIQAAVSPDHADLIVAHLKELGFNRVWLRPIAPRAQTPNLQARVPNTFIIRLGPHETKEMAEKERERFKESIGKNPLKKPRLSWRDSFVTQYP